MTNRGYCEFCRMVASRVGVWLVRHVCGEPVVQREVVGCE